MSYMFIDISIDLLRAWEHLVGLLVVLLVPSVFRVALDQILLVGQVMENLIRISKRRRYEFPKSTTGSRRNVFDLFVQMCVKIGRAWSFFLLNISTHHWKRLASFGSQMMPIVQNSVFFWIWCLSEMYTSELAVSFSCRIYRSIIRDAQTHIVHRRLRCWCRFAAWLFWHACYLSFSSCFFFKRRIHLGGPMTAMTICFSRKRKEDQPQGTQTATARDMTTAALCFASASGDVAEADLEIRETMIMIGLTWINDESIEYIIYTTSQKEK